METGRPEIDENRRSDTPAPGIHLDSFIAFKPTVRNRVIHLFIWLHIISIFAYTMPLNIFPLTQIRKLTSPYIMWAGLDQSWDMFSPNPRNYDSTLKALVITQHGNLHSWAFRFDEALDWKQRFFLDRDRAFQEFLSLDKSEPVLPEVALHIARSFNNASDLPFSVRIIDSRYDIRPGNPKADLQRQTRILYKGIIDPELLK
jgi:hypothetical protein